jgi:hypothetical protein
VWGVSALEGRCLQLLMALQATPSSKFFFGEIHFDYDI